MAPRPTAERYVASRIVDALRRNGFVDPDDDTVPMWPDRDRSSAVWVSPLCLATALVAELQPLLSDSLESICSRCGLRGHTSAWCADDGEPVF